MPVIKGLLDDLWQKNVLSTEDKDFVMENQTSKVDRARCLIDMVMGKGDRASQMMVDSLMDRDGELWFSLGLIPSPGMEVSSVENWSSKLIPSPDILKTEILKDIDNVSYSSEIAYIMFNDSLADTFVINIMLFL
ncbi:hypothetical protein NHX12_000077 [Muraenolepis orangiensis]|uniref:CARD domain-containing protein n=1 Tax=Muraenolepis orangiensis TaxID=630683 RepID=A0A9Q0I2U1_9TELE|nr:hypothetical protein NHX12_000077 [Muraenolepis orangiensis]